MVLINVVSLLSGLLLAFFIPAIRESTSIWQKVIIILIAWDDLGGVLANLTRSTNDFHRRSRRIRLIFYALHFVQPLVLLCFFNTEWVFFIFCWLYPVLSAFLVTDVIETELGNLMAGVFWLVGIILYLYLIPQPRILLWFGITFFTKLILGYAIDHYPADKRV